jgi:hypothetical protein
MIRNWIRPSMAKVLGDLPLSLHPYQSLPIRHMFASLFPSFLRIHIYYVSPFAFPSPIFPSDFFIHTDRSDPRSNSFLHLVPYPHRQSDPIPSPSAKRKPCHLVASNEKYKHTRKTTNVSNAVNDVVKSFLCHARRFPYERHRYKSPKRNHEPPNSNSCRKMNRMKVTGHTREKFFEICIL